MLTTRGSICVPPTVTYLPYRVSGSTLTAVGLFFAAGPMACNSLPDFIRDPTSSTDCFRRPLKTYFSRVTSASSALGVLNDYALYKSTQSLTHSHRAGHLSRVEVRSGRERSGGKCPTNSLGSKWGALPLPLWGVYVHRRKPPRRLIFRRRT